MRHLELRMPPPIVTKRHAADDIHFAGSDYFTIGGGRRLQIEVDTSQRLKWQRHRLLIAENNQSGGILVSRGGEIVTSRRRHLIDAIQQGAL